jgi:hypothetical protein
MKSKMPFFALLAFIVPFALYICTLAPAFLWSDSAKLAIYTFEGDYFGFGHGYHALHTLLGVLFSLLPFDFAYSQNLMSAFFSASASLLFFFLACELGYKKELALVGALTLAASHSFWLYSVINETYAIHAFFLFLVLYCAVKYKNSHQYRYFYMAYLFSGLAIYNHSIALFFLPATFLITFCTSGSKLKKTVCAPVCFIAGMLPQFLIPLIKHSPDAVFNSVFGDTTLHFATYFQISKILMESLKFIFYIAYQFPSFALIAGCLGCWRLYKKDTVIGASLALFFVMNTVFSASYFFQRQFAILIVSYAIFAVWIVAGLEYILYESRLKPKKIITGIICLHILASPFLVYYSFPDAYKASGITFLDIRQLPCRDSVKYFFLPDKSKEYGAVEYAESAWAKVEHNAIIIADFNPGMALLYTQKILGQRKDVQILLAIDNIVHTSKNPAGDIIALIEKHIGQRPVYLADTYEPYYHIGEIRKKFTLEKIGPLARIAIRDN